MATVTIALNYTPIAGTLGLVAVPVHILALLAGLTALYVAANELTKQHLLSLR